MTLQGRAPHNVVNVLAAVAALVAQGDCTFDVMMKGLRSFSCNVKRNPLRLNVLHVNGVTVLHDYAHNLAAYHSILATAQAMSCDRIVGVITAPGDRRDTDLKEIAKLCAHQVDEIVVYEIEEHRGRPPGETLSILHTNALTAARESTPVHTVMGAQQAVLLGFKKCVPGDLLLVGGATSLNDLKLIMEQPGYKIEVDAIFLLSHMPYLF